MSPAAIAPGVHVTLLRGRAPGLLVENASRRPLTVFGDAGESFLRIGPDGVDANLHSATWWRSARSVRERPTATGPAEPPEWQRVSTTPRFSWIEPRANATNAPGTGTGPKPGPDVARWQVPMQLGDERLLVTGIVTSN